MLVSCHVLFIACVLCAEEYSCIIVSHGVLRSTFMSLCHPDCRGVQLNHCVTMCAEGYICIIVSFHVLRGAVVSFCNPVY